MAYEVMCGLSHTVAYSSFLACTTRHQPRQRAVLGHVDCFVQCEVVGSQIALDGVQPRDTRTSWWSLPVIWWGSR